MFHLSSRPDSGDEYVAALSAGRFEIPNCAQNSCNLSIDDSGNLLLVCRSAILKIQRHQAIMSYLTCLESGSQAAPSSKSLNLAETWPPLEKNLQATFKSDTRFEEAIFNDAGSKAYLPVDAFGWLEFNVAPWNEAQSRYRVMPCALAIGSSNR